MSEAFDAFMEEKADRIAEAVVDEVVHAQVDDDYVFSFSRQEFMEVDFKKWFEAWWRKFNPVPEVVDVLDAAAAEGHAIDDQVDRMRDAS